MNSSININLMSKELEAYTKDIILSNITEESAYQVSQLNFKTYDFTSFIEDTVYDIIGHIHNEYNIEDTDDNYITLTRNLVKAYIETIVFINESFITEDDMYIEDMFLYIEYIYERFNIKLNLEKFVPEIISIFNNNYSNINIVSDTENSMFNHVRLILGWLKNNNKQNYILKYLDLSVF